MANRNKNHVKSSYTFPNIIQQHNLSGRNVGSSSAKMVHPIHHLLPPYTMLKAKQTSSSKQTCPVPTTDPTTYRPSIEPTILRLLPSLDMKIKRNPLFSPSNQKAPIHSSIHSFIHSFFHPITKHPPFIHPAHPQKAPPPSSQTNLPCAQAKKTYSYSDTTCQPSLRRICIT